ncbi:MAG: HEAT repeat domain-containing protein [Actinomycetota bacterium]
MILLLSVTGLATACTSGEGSGGEGVVEPVEAVHGFVPGAPDSIDRLNEVVAQGGDVIPSLEPLLTDSDPVRRWAALYVTAILADSEEDADVLTPVLRDPDLTNRVIAAGSLCGLGRKEAIPVLIEGLTAAAMLPYTDPPTPVADLAREAREAYTGESFESQGEWVAWWDEAGAEIRWDGERYVAG